jgi:hypothetical protein
VMAFDAGHAREIARAQHPTGKLSAVPAELLEGQDRHKLLAVWLRGGRGELGTAAAGSNQPSIRIQTHHSRATGTIASASTARP